ncbi:MAG: S-layer homology domain-containing protein [Oscillospiraceae bacterium]|nr:S-layer homology domain-containing protein [Oscillospiraceae bacterium]
MGGYGDGRFGPNNSVTREQLAVMLWRYVGRLAATNRELHFTDVDQIGEYVLDALRWATELGAVNGYSNGELHPKELATRAQVAQMLKNFLENQ